MALPQSSSLSKLFSTPESIITKDVPRLCIALEALDKCGKTHYSLFTAPDPICLVTNDTGTPHLLKKALAAGRRIPHVMELSYSTPDPAITRKEDIDRDEWAAWKREWARFKAGMQALLTEDPRSPTRTRTLVRDTETEIWNLCMLAHFGKTTKITQNLRTECNADYSKVFWDLYRGRPDLNMILIHKLKKEYKQNSKGEDSWTGGYATSGMNQIGFHVDLTLRAGWDPIQKSMFTEMINPTRFGFNLLGRRWYGENSGFGLLALDVFPETLLTPEIWGL